MVGLQSSPSSSLCQHPPTLQLPSGVWAVARQIYLCVMLPVLPSSSLIIAQVPSHPFIHPQPDDMCLIVFSLLTSIALIKLLKLE